MGGPQQRGGAVPFDPGAAFQRQQREQLEAPLGAKSQAAPGGLAPQLQRRCFGRMVQMRPSLGRIVVALGA